MSSLSVTLERPAARVAVLVVRVALGALFVYSAVGKLMAPREFAEAIAHYHLVPDVIATTMAAALPVVELVVGLALVTGVHGRGAAIIAGAMLVVFAVAMAQAIVRDIDIDCGCFGKASTARVGWPEVLRNLLYTLGCALVVVAPDVSFRLRTAARAPRPS